jgi:hypothetical protein
MLVATLAMTGGCGDNDNSGDNGNDNVAPEPTRTATPVAGVTATPVAATATPAPQATATPDGTTTQTVDFDFTASTGIQAFQIRATYPTANGSFNGSAENVNCTITGGGGIFTKNDNDTGALTLSVANTANLTFPINIECPFDATSPIAGTDIVVTVQEVTENNAPGNVADLTVAVTVQ